MRHTSLSITLTLGWGFVPLRVEMQMAIWHACAEYGRPAGLWVQIWLLVSQFYALDLLMQCKYPLGP